MKFYNRENELKQLKHLEKLSKTGGKIATIIGRRRMGKTRLVLEAFGKNKNFIYLFVSKKEESLLVHDFKATIEQSLKISIPGDFSTTKQIVEFLLQFSEKKHIVVAMDEFQEFYNINPSVFSEIQGLWDRYKEKAKILFIFSGSIYRLMKKIFENKKEPLFGRAYSNLIIEPFPIKTMKKIFKDMGNTDKRDFFDFFTITGGVPRYVEFMFEEKRTNLNQMLDAIFSKNSFFLEEGKNLLIEEFGKDYKTYFSILSLISKGKTSRREIESVLQKSVGGYLEKLEEEYKIIKRLKPVFSKPNTKNVKFFIEDNFLAFWFQFVYKNSSILEIENFKLARQKVLQEYNVFAGRVLEKYFKQKLKESGKWEMIGSYWEKGNRNEIDIVCTNSIEKKALIAEVKLNKKKGSIPALKEKSAKIVNLLKGYSIVYKILSIDEV